MTSCPGENSIDKSLGIIDFYVKNKKQNKDKEIKEVKKIKAWKQMLNIACI